MPVAFKYFKMPDLCDYRIKYYFSDSISEEDPRSWTPHIHDTLELYVLVEGDVSFAVESSTHRLTPGDAIITKPNEIHNCILNSRSVHRHMCFWFDTSSEFIFGDFLAHAYGAGNHLSPSAEEKAQLLPLYRRMAEANERGDAFTEFSLSLEILGIFKAHLAPKDTEDADYPPLMRDILLDITENITRIKNLDYLSAKYYLSHSTLYRLFKAYLNTTPRQYIETKRLAYARKLLKNGLSVKETARAAGFSNESNFIRLFKSRFGITPREYKMS